MTRAVRIGVIGAGSIAQQMHLPYLTELDDCFDVVGLCDVSGALASEVGARFDVPLVTTDLSKLLALEPEAVLVAVNGPPERLVLDAIATGAHVLVEKPIAWSPRGARAIEEAAVESGRVVKVGYMKCHDPAVAVAARLLGEMSPILGGVVRCVSSLNALYIADVAPTIVRSPLDDAVRAALEAQAEAALDEIVARDEPELRTAYRFLLGITCHELSVLRVLLGGADEVVSASVWGDGQWFQTTLRYGDARVSYMLGRVVFRCFDEVFELYAERETLTLSFPSPFLKNAPTIVTRRHERNGADVEERIVSSYEEAFRRELIDFHRCVTDELTPPASTADAAHDARILAAIVRAARTGASQTVE